MTTLPDLKSRIDEALNGGRIYGDENHDLFVDCGHILSRLIEKLPQPQIAVNLRYDEGQSNYRQQIINIITEGM